MSACAAKNRATSATCTSAAACAARASPARMASTIDSVLMQLHREAARVDDRAPHARPNGEVGHRVQQAGQQLVARCLGDQVVKRDVAVDAIALGRGVRHPFEQGLELGQLAFGDEVRRESGQLGLDDAPGLEHLGEARARGELRVQRDAIEQAAEIQRPQVGAVALARAQDSRVHEGSHRLAQHVAGDAQAGGELGFGWQALAGLDLAAEQQDLEILDGVTCLGHALT